MTTLREAAQQALEALEWYAECSVVIEPAAAAITALRAALAQQAEPVEPYCYVYEYDGVFGLHREFYPLPYNGMKPSRTVPVYTAPPQRAPLTEEELDALAIDEDDLPNSHLEFARAIERAHGIKE